MGGSSALIKVPKKQLRTQNQPLAAKVADQLTKWIISGTLEAGCRLNEAEIAEKLGVSRIPVREAFRVLEKSGLVVSAPYQGCSVRSITQEMLRETYILRQDFESLAAYHAAEHITDEEIEVLEELLDRLEECTLENDVSGRKYYDLNKEFHMTIYKASGLFRLVGYIDQLWNSIAYLRMRKAFEKTYPKFMKDEHRSYVQTLKERNGKKLSEQIKENLSSHYHELYENYQAE